MLLPVSFGFSLPLLLLLSAEAVWGILLLAPRPLNDPGIRLAQLTNTKTGSTVVYTLTAVLAILMLSPLYDVMRMAQAAKATEMTSPVGLPAGSLAAQTQAATLQADEGLQARTQLNLLLTSGVIAALHFMRRFGSTLAECNRLTSLEEDMKVSAKQGVSVGFEDQVEVHQEGEGNDKVVVGEDVATGAQKGLKEE